MTHHCHWPGCEIAVPPKMWGCRKHWFALPKNLRDEIWRTYVPGQEITKTPSREYLDVARRVQEWIFINDSNTLRVMREYTEKRISELTSENPDMGLDEIGEKIKLELRSAMNDAIGKAAQQLQPKGGKP